MSNLLIEQYISLGYSKSRKEFGTTYTFIIEHNKIIFHLNIFNICVFNSDRGISKIDYKKKIINAITNLNKYQNLNFSEKYNEVIELDYNLDSLNLLLNISLDLEEKDLIIYKKQLEKYNTQIEQYKKLVSFLKQEKIKVSHETFYNKIVKENLPNIDYVKSLSTFLKLKIEEFLIQTKIVEDEQLIIESINTTKQSLEEEKQELIKDFDRFMNHSEFGLHFIDSGSIEDLLYSDLIKESTKNEYEPLIEAFQMQEERRLGTGDDRFFIKLREQLIKDLNIFKRINE